MIGFLKQSTASQSRMVGPFVDDTDFKTLETGLTIANTDVKLSVNGAAGANKNSGGGTHRNNGMYSLTFDATDTATVGELEGSIAVAGALVVVFKFIVLEESIYDSLFAASAAGFDANQRVNLGLWLGSAPNALVSSRVDVSVGAMASGVLTATAIAADAITAAKVAADVSAEIADQVWDEVLSGHATGGSAGAALTGAGSAGDPWSTTIPGSYGAGTAGERMGRIPNVAAGGNGGIALADAAGRVKADVERWLAGTPNALQSGRIDSYVGAVASAVIGAASFASGALDAVWATATRTLSAFGFSVTVGTNNDKTGYRLSATGVDDVWDEALSGHLGAGSTGAKLNDAGGAGTPPTVAAIADAVWDEALSGHLSAGSTGLKLNSAGGAGGSGALARTIGISVAGNPLQAAAVWVSTDIGGTNVVAGPLITNSSGVVTVLVDAGTYYVWVRKDGFNPIVAQAVTVS